MKLVFPISAFLLGILSAQCQNPVELTLFKAQQIGQSVFLSWRLDTGQTCQGIGIFRGSALSEMHQIGEIPGFCGSTSKSTDYDFTDDQPEEGVENFYMLTLGQVGNSDTIGVVVLPDTEGQILFVPMEGSRVRAFFENPATEEVSYSVVDPKGAVVQEGEVSGKSIVLDTEGRPGLFILHLQFMESKKKLCGKWMSLR